jgi:predicted Zn finger-like uncharacterized protein
MIIECPSCLTRFNVPDQALLPDGRKVKCANCQNKWHEDPPAEVSNLPEEPETPDEENDLEGENDLGDDNGEDSQDESQEEFIQDDEEDDENTDYSGSMEETLVAIREEQNQEEAFDEGEEFEDDGLEGEAGSRKIPFKLIGWVSLVVFLLGFVTVFGFFKDQLVGAWPPASQLYSLIGVEVQIHTEEPQDTIPEAVLNPEDYITMVIKARFEAGADGSNVLIVSGDIISLADFDIILPRAKGTLKDENETIIHEWFFDIPQGIIVGGTVIPFETKVLSAPADTRNIKTDFLWP